jgi:hypothetical protein
MLDKALEQLSAAEFSLLFALLVLCSIAENVVTISGWCAHWSDPCCAAYINSESRPTSLTADATRASIKMIMSLVTFPNPLQPLASRPAPLGS